MRIFLLTNNCILKTDITYYAIAVVCSSRRWMSIFIDLQVHHAGDGSLDLYRLINYIFFGKSQELDVCEY